MFDKFMETATAICAVLLGLVLLSIFAALSVIAWRAAWIFMQ